MNKSLYVRDADAQLWKDAERFLAGTGETIAQVVTRLLRRELDAHNAVHSQRDWQTRTIRDGGLYKRAVCHCAQCNAIRGERP